MKTRIPAVSLLILIAVLAFSLSLAGTGAQAAGTCALMFASNGVYPVTATANSQRWFRCNLTWDEGTTNAGTDANPVLMVNDRIVSLQLLDPTTGTIQYNGGYGGNFFTTIGPPNPPAQNGAQYGVAVKDHSGGTTGSVDVTVGPFAGFNFNHLVGSLATGYVVNQGDIHINFPFTFVLTYQTWDNTKKTYVTQPALKVGGTYNTCPLSPVSTDIGEMGASGELMYWYTGGGAGVTPLTVSNELNTPDQGAGSDDYTFQVVYDNFIPGLFPTFRAPIANAMPPEGDPYCRFEAYVIKGLTTGSFNNADKTTALDSDYSSSGNGYNPYRDWGYGVGDAHMDAYGNNLSSYDGYEAILTPKVLLVLDHNYQQPYYMVDAGPAPGGNGEIWKYEIKPTNFLQVFNNVFQFPFNPSGGAWDGYATLIQGKPDGNGYVALGAGKHTYEFLVSRDWDPPVAKITDSTTGRVAVGKRMVAVSGRPGNSLGIVDLVTNWQTQFGFTGNTAAGWRQGWSSTDPYGYAYDSQSGNYPKLNPILAGWPASFKNVDGVGAFAYPFNSYPSIDPPLYPGEPRGIEPWGDLNAPLTTFTNADTIWPDYVNISGNTGVYNPDVTKPSAFRGGKWTTNTNYVFRVLYFQSDNLAPQAAQVFIRKTLPNGGVATGWQAFPMQKVYSLDSNYAKGVIYYYASTAQGLPGGGGPGDYNYYFSFNDGLHTAIYPNRPITGADNKFDPGSIGVPPVPTPGATPNNFFWFRVNNPPVLSNPTVSPTSGVQAGDYVFGATYQSFDTEVRNAGSLGTAPYKSLCWIDLFGDVQGQMQVKSIAGSKITYGFVATSSGNHVPYAAGSLAGTQNGQPMQVNFQTGADVNQQFPITANALVTAGANGTGTITVTGTPPGVVVGDQFQVVNWFPVNMYQKNAGPTDYTKGVPFIFDTLRAGMQIDPGVHNFYFEYWDNWAYWINWEQYFMVGGSTPANLQVEGEMTRLPAAPGSYYQGPTIMASQPPQMSGIYFAPPTADTVAGVVDASHLNYIRPVGRVAYANNSLAGLYLQFQTGRAALRVYQITGNTTTQMTVKKVGAAGDLLSDQVVLGDTFRLFTGWSAAAGLAGDYHQDPSTTFDGTPGTNFTLYATYSDAGNNPPASIRVATYASLAQPANSPTAIYDLVPVVAGTTTFVSGVLYQTVAPVALAAGQHWLRVQANDGSSWFAGGATANDWFGPAFNPALPAVGPVVIVNHPPNPPVSGFAPANNVSVNTATPTLRWDPATDPDPGDSVVAYTVQLSKNGFANGVYDYQYFTTSNSVAVTTALSDLTTWSWRVRSQDTLGAQSAWSQVQTFYVNLNIPAGVLAPPGGVAANSLTPVVGDLSTTFTYAVVYSNTANLAPPSGVYVEIDGNLYPTPLSPPPTGPYNYVTGVTYTIAIRGDAAALGYGQHNYRFYAGAVAWPAAPATEAGPWIDTPSTISIDDATWAPITTLQIGTPLRVQVSDPDKTTYKTLNVTVTAGGNTQTLTLTQLAKGSDIFRGALKTVDGPGPSPAGTLELEPPAAGVTATATYTDPATVGSPSPDVAKTTVQIVDTLAPPVVAPLTVKSGPQGVSLTLDWSGYKAPLDLAGYHVWFSPAPFSNESGLTAVATLKPGTTSYEIPGLQPQTTYYAAVTAFDSVPNENKNVPGQAVKTQDTAGPDISAETPAPGATQVALNTPVSFTLTDPSGVNLSSILVSVNGAAVSASKLTLVPATGRPTSVQVSFTAALAWNEKVIVAVQAADALGNQSDSSWKFSTRTDTVAPHVANLVPKQNATGVPVDQTLSFDLVDAISGVNVKSLGVTLNNAAVPDAALTINSTNLNDVTVSYKPAGGLPIGATTTVVINASDVAGNVMSPFTWKFTTLYEISGTVTTADGKGLAGVSITDGIINTTTAADGTYKLVGVANGHYVIKPSLLYYRFDPVSTPVQVNGASLPGINFTAIPQTYSVTGTILDWTGGPVVGIPITAIETVNSQTTTQATKSNTQGQYAFSGLLPGTVTITPSNKATGAQYAFVPAVQTVTIPLPAGASEDFTAYAAFTHTFPKGKSMVGVPFNPLVPTATQVFGTPLIARWNPLASPPGYVMPSDPNSAAVLDVHPGQGYFVSYVAPHTLPNLAGTPVDMTMNSVLGLGPVWNMIANPFPVALPLADLVPTVPNGTDPYVFAYDNVSGSYLFVSALPGLNVARTYLNPWEGAWLRSLVGVTSVLAIPPLGAARVESVTPQGLALSQGDYVIPVTARGGNRAALYGAAGVRAAGAYEIPDPPALAGSVDLYFVNDKGQALAQQLKPAGAGPQTFKFVVSTDLPQTTITVSLPDLSQVPNNLAVMLVDEDTGKSVYARTTPQYTFQSGAHGAVRHFSLEIGPRGTNNLVVSAASAQQTGPGVVVTYSLSGPCQVTVEVLNVAGRLVRRLAANSLAAAGVNNTTWNLRGDSGAAVPGGLYLVRVTAVSDNGQKVQAITQVNVNR